MPVFSRLDGLEAKSWLSPCHNLLQPASQPATKQPQRETEREREEKRDETDALQILKKVAIASLQYSCSTA